jgi:hypothetical protein
VKSITRILIAPALLLTYFIGSEAYWAWHISPSGLSTISDFYRVFGDPHSARQLRKEGQVYYELSGHLPAPFVLAFPSSAPSYVFTEQGNFYDWSRAPGDDTPYIEKWRSPLSIEIDIPTLKTKLK